MDYTEILLNEEKNNEKEIIKTLKNKFEKDKEFLKFKKANNIPELLDYVYNTGEIEKISKQYDVDMDVLAKLVKKI